MATEKVLTINGENFEKSVTSSSTPVLVDFWAPWCGPCRMIAPVIDELAEEFEGKVVFGKVNVDDEAEISSRFKIMSIPTMILFKEGQVLDKIVGARSKNELSDFIKKNTK